jgi:aquaporin Z
LVQADAGQTQQMKKPNQPSEPTTLLGSSLTLNERNNMHTLPLYKKLLSESFGTFWIVFAGTSAIVVNGMHGDLTHLGIAATFGMVVFAMIAALGDVSGAHFNPAVTIAFYIAKRFPGKTVLPYILSQCLGAILASLVVHYLFPFDTKLGATIPSGSFIQSWVLEVILTMGLMFVILNVSTGANEKGITAGIAIG